MFVKFIHDQSRLPGSLLDHFMSFIRSFPGFKKNWMHYLLLFFLAIPSLSAFSQQQVVSNPGFETTGSDTARPSYWRIGFRSSPYSYADSAGSWAYDSSYATQGARSLRMMPSDTDGYVITQILHLPTYDLKNKKVHLELDIRHQGLAQPPVVVLAAINPELPPDPALGVGVAGKTIVQPGVGQTSFTTYQDSFVASAQAEYMQVMLITEGNSGSAWFDDIEVHTKVAQPGPPLSDVPSPLSDPRNFSMAFTTQAPIDRSEKAMEEAADRTQQYADVMNIFTHVRWGSLTGEPLTHGHKEALEWGELADERGLDKVLTFDFTHGSPQEVGELNPLPNGDTVGSLNDNSVQKALKEELLALADTLDPAYVIVGIEMNLFYDKNPGQWGAYVDLFKALADSLHQMNSNVHVSSYFTLRWMVDPSTGNLNSAHANVWQQLLPELESVGYSMYPGNGFYPHPDSLPAGYYTKAQQVAPNKPLLLNEFGVYGGDSTNISEAEQAQTMDSIFKALNGVNTELTSWYSIFDKQYLGQPDWFKDAFDAIALYYKDGTPKKGFAHWEAVYKTPTFLSPEKGDGGQGTELRVAPSPVRGEKVKILFRSGGVESLSLSLLDLQGRTVRSLYKGDIGRGMKRFRFSTRGLPAGLYIVRVETGEMTLARKLIVADR